MPDFTALGLLGEMSARVRERRLPFPEQEQVNDSLNLIAFSMLGCDLLIDMRDVLEVFDMPEVTRLPRVRNWVCGVANMHGTILPIVDLAVCQGAEGVRGGRTGRVLALRHPDLRIGLVIDRVFGIRHLAADDVQPLADGQIPQFVRELCSGQIEIESETWPLFSVDRLEQSEIFQQIEVA